MEDGFLRRLSEYALKKDIDLDGDVELEVRCRLLDVVGCALGGRHDGSSVAVGAYVRGLDISGPVSLWGSQTRTGPREAALVNGTAARCLDFNDGFQGRHGDGGHPSDVIPALVGVAELSDAVLIDLVASIAVAYEVVVSLLDAMSVRRQGFDHVSAQAIAVACGAGRLLGLNVPELESAVAIAAVAGPALWQTRKDPVTMWKSVAAAYAASHAVEACLLARSGVIGPSKPFEGVSGYLEVLGGGAGFDTEAFTSIARGEMPRKILMTNLKRWPVGQYAQSAIDAALELHDAVGSTSVPMTEVVIHTFEQAVVSMARAANWDPPNRESADHSLPYSVVVALLYGPITPAMFSSAMRADPEVRRLLSGSVQVKARPEYDAIFPARQPSEIEVRWQDGTVRRAERLHYRGHMRNPASVDDYVEKFTALTAGEVQGSPAELARAIVGLDSPTRVRFLTDMVDRAMRDGTRGIHHDDAIH